MSKESVYDEQIAPLMSKIISICKEHEIATFAHFRLDDVEPDDKILCSTALPVSKNNKDNKVIQDLINVTKHGHAVVPNSFAMTISGAK